MFRRVVELIVVVALGIAGVSGSAIMAAPSDTGHCRQDVNAALQAGSSEGTRGDAISDGFYGNEPNIEGPYAPGGPEEQEPGTQAGRVVPSQSPGPKVTDPDGSVQPGDTWGDVQSDLVDMVCGS